MAKPNHRQYPHPSNPLNGPGSTGRLSGLSPLGSYLGSVLEANVQRCALQQQQEQYCHLVGLQLLFLPLPYLLQGLLWQGENGQDLEDEGDLKREVIPQG